MRSHDAGPGFLLPAVLGILIAVSACDPRPAAPACRAQAPTPEREANAGCVILDQDHLLVLRHRFGGELGIPGGASQKGESAQCTAHRETWEETGLDVRVGRELGRLRYGYTLYRCHPEGDLDRSTEPVLPWFARLETTGVEWMPLEALPRDQWRYREQVDAFLELVERARSREAQ